jgi:hypothetical protein
MNRRSFVVTGTLGLIGFGRRQSSTPEAEIPAGLHVVQPASALPSFSLSDLKGQTVRSAELLGNVLILRFWATW